MSAGLIESCGATMKEAKEVYWGICLGHISFGHQVGVWFFFKKTVLILYYC